MYQCTKRPYTGDDYKVLNEGDNFLKRWKREIPNSPLHAQGLPTSFALTAPAFALPVALNTFETRIDARRHRGEKARNYSFLPCIKEVLENSLGPPIQGKGQFLVLFGKTPDDKVFRVDIEQVVGRHGQGLRLTSCCSIERPKDWLAQAWRDLEQARSSQSDGKCEWACFAAQQSAEKAVKALHLAFGLPSGEEWKRHHVAGLLDKVPFLTLKGLVENATRLDRLYVRTRYPSDGQKGAPFIYYQTTHCKEAIRDATEILEFVDNVRCWSNREGDCSDLSTAKN